MILSEEDMAHVLTQMRSWERMRSKRIFLTGASGFVGTWLAESFEWANDKLALGAELVKIPRNSLPDGDFDFGIHAAKADTFAADMVATRRILNFATQRGVTRLLYTSSGAVYGAFPPGMTNVREDFICAPETKYALAKFVGEQLCGGYNFCTVIARMFTFVGPLLPLNLNFAVGNFMRDVIAGQGVKVEGDGVARRSYLYAADLAIWLWTLLLEGENERPYNVGSPDAVSILELAHAVVENTVPGTRIAIGGNDHSGVYVPSVKRARIELGLLPLISMDEGIRRMYAWNLRPENREMLPGPATTT